MASAKKALSTGPIKDPGKKKRGQILKALKAAAKIDEL